MQAIADLRGWSPLVALQIEYSLMERTTKRELIPMANEMGLGVVPWSPLANGILSGKYSREDFLNKSGSTELHESPFN
jgi:aryl-alcohol dehydrogenase-like predicted oxidoreductase